MMTWFWAVAVLWIGACYSEQLIDNDSLRGALEAINRRQRALADPTLYYLEQLHSPREGAVRIMYPRHSDGDGQPEDIGYGFQKSLAPKTVGVFEAIPLPESELGSHDPGVQSHTPEGKALENIILDYIEDNVGSSIGVEPQRYHYQNQNSDAKRSVFRERDINDLPDALQNVFPDEVNPEQYFENGEHSQVLPSSFRERLSSKPSRNNLARNAQALVKNFGGLNRDTDHFPENGDDSDEYLSLVNSIWEKYQDSNPDNFDTEDLSDSDVADILAYITHKERTKRQHDNSYETGYDFFNSPLAWVKRDRQRLTDNPKPSSDQFLHALKFLNSHTDTLESMQEEDVPDEERDTDVAKLLMEEHMSPKNSNQYRKRFWRGNSFEDQQTNIVKRYPIAKRSSSYYTNPASLYHKAATERFSQRKKKNAHTYDSVTDPKVARELSDIFSSSDNITVDKKVHKVGENTDLNQLKVPSDVINNTNPDVSTDNNSSHSKTETKNVVSNHIHSSHAHGNKSGQKEEPGIDSQNKPLGMSKKSVDWSDYFGIDKRRKKSTNKAANDEWLLDQYLKAYSISARAIKDSSASKDENPHFAMNKKSSDDMDAKLRAMEDMIVDQALKYTGAHEGITDTEEVQAVKDRVIAQLAAAYSLEKMRKALSEFKSSIAAQKSSAPTHTTTNAPTEIPEQKNKRVAVKKEKAGIPPEGKLEKKDDSNNRLDILHPGHSHSEILNQEESCPILDEITQRCKMIANMAGDSSEALVPLCSIHQICFLCGPEMGAVPSGCDFTFLSEANNLCGNSPRCRYTVRRTIATIHSLRGDPSPQGCDWQNHPCLAHYLAVTMR